MGANHSSQSTSSSNNLFDPHNATSTSSSFADVHHNDHHQQPNVDFGLSPLHMGYSPSTCSTADTNHHHVFKPDDGSFKSEMPLINLNSGDLSPIVGRFHFNQQTESSSLGESHCHTFLTLLFLIATVLTPLSHVVLLLFSMIRK